MLVNKRKEIDCNQASRVCLKQTLSLNKLYEQPVGFAPCGQKHLLQQGDVSYRDDCTAPVNDMHVEQSMSAAKNDASIESPSHFLTKACIDANLSNKVTFRRNRRKRLAASSSTPAIASNEHRPTKVKKCEKKFPFIPVRKKCQRDLRTYSRHRQQNTYHRENNICRATIFYVKDIPVDFHNNDLFTLKVHPQYYSGPVGSISKKLSEKISLENRMIRREHNYSMSSANFTEAAAKGDPLSPSNCNMQSLVKANPEIDLSSSSSSSIEVLLEANTEVEPLSPSNCNMPLSVEDNPERCFLISYVNSPETLEKGEPLSPSNCNMQLPVEAYPEGIFSISSENSAGTFEKADPPSPSNSGMDFPVRADPEGIFSIFFENSADALQRGEPSSPSNNNMELSVIANAEGDPLSPRSSNMQLPVEANSEGEPSSPGNNNLELSVIANAEGDPLSPSSSNMQLPVEANSDGEPSSPGNNNLELSVIANAEGDPLSPSSSNMQLPVEANSDGESFSTSNNNMELSVIANAEGDPLSPSSSNMQLPVEANSDGEPSSPNNSNMDLSLIANAEAVPREAPDDFPSNPNEMFLKNSTASSHADRNCEPERLVPSIPNGLRTATISCLLKVKAWHAELFDISYSDPLQNHREYLVKKLTDEEFFSNPLKWLSKSYPNTKKCLICQRKKFILQASQSLSDDYFWQCLGYGCDYKLDYTKPRFFSKIKLSIPDVIKIIFQWSMNSDAEEIKRISECSFSQLWNVLRKLRQLCTFPATELVKEFGKVSVELAIVKYEDFFIVCAMDMSNEDVRFKVYERKEFSFINVAKDIELWVSTSTLLNSPLPNLNVCFKNLNVQEANSLRAERFAISLVKKLFGEFHSSFIDHSVIQEYLNEVQWRKSFGVQFFERVMDKIFDCTKNDQLNVSSTSRFQQKSETLQRKRLIKGVSCKKSLENLRNYGKKRRGAARTGGLSNKVHIQQAGTMLATPTLNSQNSIADCATASHPPQKVGAVTNGGESNLVVNPAFLLVDVIFACVRKARNELMRQNVYAGKFRYIYKCSFCSRDFYGRFCFLLHTKSHLKEKWGMKWLSPQFISNSVNSLSAFMQKTYVIEYGNLLVCLRCDKESSLHCTEEELMVHINTVHTSNPSMVSCVLCRSEFTSRSDVFEHHEKAHKDGSMMLCPVCLESINLEECSDHINTETFWHHMWQHLYSGATYSCRLCCKHVFSSFEIKSHLSSKHSSCSENSNQTCAHDSSIESDDSDHSFCTDSED